MQKVIILPLTVLFFLFTVSVLAQTNLRDASSSNLLTEFRIGSAKSSGLRETIRSSGEKKITHEQWHDGGFTQLGKKAKANYAMAAADNILRNGLSKKFPWFLFPSSKGSGKSHLSQAQNTFVKASGYPQQFIKSFGIKDGKNHVVETWTYISLGTMSSFINGKYIEDNSLEDFDATVPSGELHPEDYHYLDTPKTIVERHGKPLRLEKGQTWMGQMEVYGYSNAAFSFVDGRLKSVAFSSKYLNGRQWYSDR